MHLPKFLTTAVAELAVARTVDTVFNGVGLRDMVKRKECHIVILVPALVMTPRAHFPACTTRPHVLYEESVGDPVVWAHPYAEIARGKAIQLWQGRNGGGTDIQPHLLYSGDTPFWGGVWREGIVVSCSGVQPYFDRMIAGMVADMCIGLAYDAWDTSANKANDELCFLT